MLNAGEQGFRRSLNLALQAILWSTEERSKVISPSSQLGTTLTDPAGSNGLRLLRLLGRDELASLVDGQEVGFAVQGQRGSERQLTDALVSSLVGSERGSIQQRQYDQVRFSREGSGAESGINIELRGPNGAKRYRVNLTARNEVDREVDKKKGQDGIITRGGKRTHLRESIVDDSFDRLLIKFASATGANVLAESYHDLQPYPLSLSAGSFTVEEGLGNLLLGDRMWWNSGSLYLIQKRYWFEDRRTQVDDQLLKRIRERKRDHGLTLEEWGEIGTLSIEQWMTLQSLGLGEFQMSKQLHPLLSFYGHLESRNRTALYAYGGLESSHLGKKDLERLIDWLKGSQPEPSPFRANSRGLRISASVQEGMTWFRVWAYAGGHEPHLLREQGVPAIPRSMWPNEYKQEEFSSQVKPSK